MSSVRSRARRGTFSRASPSLRDPHATSPGAHRYRGSSSSRIGPRGTTVVPTIRSGLIVRHAEGTIHVGHAPCFRPWCGGTPLRVGSRPARRGSRRGTRAPMPSPILARSRNRSCRPKLRRSSRPPEEPNAPASANARRVRRVRRIPLSDASSPGRNCSSSPPR